MGSIEPSNDRTPSEVWRNLRPLLTLSPHLKKKLREFFTKKPKPRHQTNCLKDPVYYELTNNGLSPEDAREIRDKLNLKTFYDLWSIESKLRLMGGGGVNARFGDNPYFVNIS